MSLSPRDEALAILKRLGVSSSHFIEADASHSSGIQARSPIDGSVIATVKTTSLADTQTQLGKAEAAFKIWRKVPAPRRGEFVRLLGEELRASKADLGRLVTLEAGKITSEGLGEVQ